MDNMKIDSGFLKMIISKAIKKALIKKTGDRTLNPKIIFDGPIVFNNDGEKVKASLSLSFESSTDDFEEILNSLI